MKKFISLLLAGMMLVGTTACSQDSTSQSADSGNNTAAVSEVPDEVGGVDNDSSESVSSGGDVVVGVSSMLTGPAPLDGLRMRQAIELVVDEVNENGGVLGGRQIKLIVEDDQADQTAAVNVANKLISDGAKVIIGPHRSTSAMAVQQTMQEKKMPFITGGSSPSLADVGNPYLFTCRASDTIMAKIVAKYAVETLGAKKIGIMYNNDEFGTGGQMVAEQYFTEQGVEFISEGHNSNDKDMTGQLMKAKQAGCDTIFIWAHDAEVVVMARQITELGLDMNVVCSGAPALKQVSDLCEAEWIEGWFCATDYVSTSEEPYVKEFIEKFTAKYGEEPEMFAASYYGATLALVDAIERAGSDDSEAIRQALAEVKGIRGIVGELTAENNALVHEGSIVVIRDRQPVLEAVVHE